MKNNSDRPLILWLVIVSIMVFAMVFIGGITRLTDSGLSIVEWKPLVGTIPPLNEAEWNEAFNKYKAFPEYKIQNSHMSLDDFKEIYFWEYFHRLFGRLIGVAFFFPFVFFAFKKRIRRDMLPKLGFAFILGGAQGVLGWYMVKSGLVNKPDVSHFRLAAHLSLAFLIISYIYFLILQIKNPMMHFKFNFKKLKRVHLFFVLLWIQIVYGAFVAGLDAGLTHNTFPKMGRSWIPNEISLFKPLYINFLENPVALQFTHRLIGYVLALLAFMIYLAARKERDFLLRKTLKSLSIVVIVQFALGVLVIINYVPISLASMHQIGACVLLLVTTKAMFLINSKQNI